MEKWMTNWSNSLPISIYSYTVFYSTLDMSRSSTGVWHYWKIEMPDDDRYWYNWLPFLHTATSTDLATTSTPSNSGKCLLKFSSWRYNLQATQSSRSTMCLFDCLLRCYKKVLLSLPGHCIIVVIFQCAILVQRKKQYLS